MKRIAHQGVLLLGVVVAGCAASQPATYDPPAARTAIASVLPAGWSLEPRKSGQHSFNDDYFRDPHGDRFELVGPQEVFEEWRDREGHVQRDHDGHESMLVWLVPGDYEPDFPLPFFFYPPPPPERVYWSKGLRVYAATSKARDQEAEARASERVVEGWGFGPVPFELSWKTWKEDIARAYRDGGGAKRGAANQTAPANQTGRDPQMSEYHFPHTTADTAPASVKSFRRIPAAAYRARRSEVDRHARVVSRPTLHPRPPAGGADRTLGPRAARPVRGGT